MFKRKFTYQSDHAPQHVAMIMDGNGRWAKQRGLSRSIGHRYGINNLKKIVEASIEFNVKCLTVYAFSTENWKRPKEEIDTLFDLIDKFFVEYRDEFDAKGVKIKIIGAKEQVPAHILEIFHEAEERTKNNQTLLFQFAFNYGFTDEIIHSVKKVAKMVENKEVKISKIDHKLLEAQLYTNEAPMVDLLIRTSGEQRLSNFLLYQVAYAELYFTKLYWPDFDQKAYQAALIEYQKRNRRFGGL